MDLKIITCVSDTSDWGYQNLLKSSCDFYNLELITLRHNGNWTSHRLKDQYLLSFVEKLNGNTIVLFTDGYDTMLQCSQDEIFKKYFSFNSPLVFSAEKNCWPYQDLCHQFPQVNSLFKYLNCGAFMGEAKTIRSLLRKYRTPPSSYPLLKRLLWLGQRVANNNANNPDIVYKWSNQYYWSLVYLKQKNVISLDYDTKIFLEFSTKFSDLYPNGRTGGLNRKWKELLNSEKKFLDEEFSYRENRVLCKRTRSQPCHLHFNGPIAKEFAKNGTFNMVMPWYKHKTQ